MKKTPKALTLRLDPANFRRLAAVARAEHRTPTNYVETLVLHDLAAKDEERRVISVYAPPEVGALIPGELERSAGETDKRYARRKKLVKELLSIPDEG